MKDHSFGRFRNDINIAVLLFLSRLARSGDCARLMQMGLTLEHIKKLRSLRVDIFHRLPAAFDRVFNIKINPQLLDDALVIAEIDSDDREKVFRLIEAGAPARLMRELFGLHRRDYCAVRRYLGKPGMPGRTPSRLDESTMDRAWRCWAENRHKPVPERILAVHDKTGLPVHVILATLKLSAEETCHG